MKWVASQTDIPIAQGVVNGVGSVGDGIIAIADAFGDTAVSTYMPTRYFGMCRGDGE